MTPAWPKSLAARLTVLLISGTLVVLLAGVAVATFGILGNSPARPDRDRDLTEALVAALNGVPPADRQALLLDVSRIGLRARLGPADRNVAVETDAFTDLRAEDLRRELSPLGVEVVGAGHLISPRAHGRLHFWSAHGPILMRFRLRDGTGVDVLSRESWDPFALLRELLPILLVVAAGLTLVATWIARRVTRPLRSFALAASRLGTDTPLLLVGERGPSEFRQAAQAFEQTQERVRRLLEERTRMLAAIAHDLRTPIMRLRLRAELLDDDAERDRMEADLDEMQAMIGATLTFAREEAVSEPPEDFDLAQLMRKIEAEFRATGEVVSCHAPEEAPFGGRQGALKRALTNLIENAVRYGGSADVDLGEDVTHWILTVRDRGPGIPADQQGLVFEPFYRVDNSRSRDSGGTGLGLSVARTIIRRHGGDIELANRPGGGLRQTVTLPKGTTVPMPAESPSSGTVRHRRRG